MYPISTRSADCKDCYRCLRVCPVKAISVKDGQARVVEEKCILCGRCVLECPQKAKIVTSEIYKVRDFLVGADRVVLSIAPSFPAFFFAEEVQNLLDKIASLGFDCVEETSVGAQYTSEAYRRFFLEGQDTVISSCCPVVVNLIEIYYPKLISNLASVSSPAIAHGLSIKERLGWDTKVVFAGPCIAKMVERGLEDGIDAVLTFSQLAQLIQEKEYIGGEFKNPFSKEKMETRLFPLPGGTIRSFMGDNLLDFQVETVTGLRECTQTLAAIEAGKLNLKFVELMACRGGCINGPIMNHDISLPERKRRVIDNYNEYKNFPQKELYPVTSQRLRRIFEPRPYREKPVPEAAIKEILAQTGKYTTLDEKNCGGCGYKTCREKAIAVYLGYAEPEMCIPYMKSKAESTAHTIVNSTPNGIIVFDRKLEIKDINPAAKVFFAFYHLEVGKNLADFLDTKYFSQVIKTGMPVKNCIVNYPELDLYTRQDIVPMANSKDNLYMVIITDITASLKEKQEREKIREEILSKAQHVINNQMVVAQQIAGLLGETTAETKITLLELINNFTKETGREG
jgi:iron only hydrogenase large subunit-like protein/uncharacterized Fe-S cluster-containing protein